MQVVGKAKGSTWLSGLSQPYYEIGILICAALLIHSFNVLIGYFKCLTQFGGGSHCLNFADKFCDTVPQRSYVDQIEHKQCVINRCTCHPSGEKS